MGDRTSIYSELDFVVVDDVRFADLAKSSPSLRMTVNGDGCEVGVTRLSMLPHLVALSYCLVGERYRFVVLERFATGWRVAKCALNQRVPAPDREQEGGRRSRASELLLFAAFMSHTREYRDQPEHWLDDFDRLLVEVAPL